MKNLTLYEFLKYISECNADEAIEIISKFQNGEISIEGLTVDDC